MFYCCGTLLVFLSVRDRVYNTQNADNSSQSNTYKTFYHSLAFVRSGYVNVNDGKAYNVGNSGCGRSRTASSSTYAYILYFYTTSVNPSSNDGRYSGRPLRCLYPGSA